MKTSKKSTIRGPSKTNEGSIQILLAETKEPAIAIFEKNPFVPHRHYGLYQVQKLIETHELNN